MKSPDRDAADELCARLENLQRDHLHSGSVTGTDIFVSAMAETLPLVIAVVKAARACKLMDDGEPPTAAQYRALRAAFSASESRR